MTDELHIYIYIYIYIWLSSTQYTCLSGNIERADSWVFNISLIWPPIVSCKLWSYTMNLLKCNWWVHESFACFDRVMKVEHNIIVDGSRCMTVLEESSQLTHIKYPSTLVVTTFQRYSEPLEGRVCWRVKKLSLPVRYGKTWSCDFIWALALSCDTFRNISTCTRRHIMSILLTRKKNVRGVKNL